MEEVKHNCGFCVAHTLHDTYNFMRSLQHRGREGAGIAAIGDERIDVLKWTGNVGMFDVVDIHKIFPHYYHTFLGHIRYATRGRKDKILEDAHPHVIGGFLERRTDHIIINDCEAVIVHNGQVKLDDLVGINPGKLKTDCDSEAMLYYYKEKLEKEMLRSVVGSYTLAIADKRRKEVIVVRDRTGIKPGVLGFKDGKHCVASEDIALKENGGIYVEDLIPGSVYYLHSNGSYRIEEIVKPKLAHCFFEWNYIADVNSTMNNESVRSARISLGKNLAEEFHPTDADFVTFLPRCPETAARSYASHTKIPFLEVFYKMRGERSFLGSTAEERTRSIKNNLHLMPGIGNKLEGKNIIVVDDSTIRGNNARRASRLLHDAGVKKVYLANYTPPIGVIGEEGIARGCLFGVDMPPNDDFIIRKGSLKEIGMGLKVELVYLSVEGMFKAFEQVGMPRHNLCSYCIGGKHPFL